MKRGTRFFLLAGCALVLSLDAPATVGLLREAWRGPYSAELVTARSAAVRPESAPEGVALAAFRF